MSSNSIYAINKGINWPIIFKGVSGQYIYYLAGGLLGLLILFAILYMAKLNTYVCMVVIFGAGTLLITTISRLSRKYGQYGLMKGRPSYGCPITSGSIHANYSPI